MIRLDVLRLLEEKGKTKYWLYKQLGMSYQNFSKMINNQTKSIRYENIETMCLLLECTPNDLLVITEDMSSLRQRPHVYASFRTSPVHKIIFRYLTG